MPCTSCSIRSLVNMVRRGNVTGAYEYAAKHSTEGLSEVFRDIRHIEGNQPNDTDSIAKATKILEEVLTTKKREDLGA